MKRSAVIIFLSVFIFKYSNAVNLEIGFGRTNLNINGKINIQQEDIVIRSSGNPTVEHFFLNLEFPGTLIPNFKFEYISHIHTGSAKADVKLPVVIKENPFYNLYRPFYKEFDRFSSMSGISFYKDIKLTAVSVSQKTKAYEYDFIFYYKFHPSNYFVPKFGIAVKNLKVKTRYTIKIPLFLFKLSDEIDFSTVVPMVYYGFELYLPVIPKIFLLEWNTEGKEIYAKRNFVIDLKTVIKLRLLSFLYFKNAYIGLGYRHWKLDTRTKTKKTKQELREKYRWYGIFTEIGVMF